MGNNRRGATEGGAGAMLMIRQHAGEGRGGYGGGQVEGHLGGGLKRGGGGVCNYEVATS